MNSLEVNLTEREEKVFCFLKRYPNLEVDSLVGRSGLRGIPMNQIPQIIKNLQHKSLLACYEHKKPDLANVWKYIARGQQPFKTIKNCRLSRLGLRVAKERC